jgi:hypothetical protein
MRPGEYAALVQAIAENDYLNGLQACQITTAQMINIR